MKYQALALDLDGTLTNSKKKITKKTKEIIWKAMDKGVQIILVSGRPLLGIEKLAKELELYKLGGYIIAYNGCQIIECHSHKLIFESLIPETYYKKICELGRINKVQTLTYNEFGILSESDNDPFVNKEAFNNALPITKVDMLEYHIHGLIPKFMMVGEHERLQQAESALLDEFNSKLAVFFSEPYFLEIVPQGIDKSKALDHLLNYLGIDRERLMACGDGLNDLTMLQYAGFSVAMENANEEIKKAADFITRSNDMDGVAFAVSKFMLQ